MGIGAAILMVVLFVIMMGLSKSFRNEAGVAPPSASAYRGIKRRARKRGISTEQALDEWIENKQRRK